MATVLREAQGSKFALREKWVLQMEALLRGPDPSAGRPSFWDEMLLLKVNAPFLLEQLEALPVSALLGDRKETIRNMVAQCVQRLQDESYIRVQHALHILTILFYCILKKKFQNYSTDVIDVIAGLSKIDALFKSMLQGIDLILQGSNGEFKSLAVALLIVLATGTDILNRNALIEFVLQTNLFSALVQCCAAAQPPLHDVSRDVIALLGLLGNYRKTEAVNAYLQQLRHLALPAGIHCIADAGVAYLSDALFVMENEGAVAGGGSSMLSMLNPSNVFSGIASMIWSGAYGAAADQVTLSEYAKAQGAPAKNIVRTHLLMALTLYELVCGESSFAVVAMTPRQRAAEIVPGSSPLDQNASDSRAKHEVDIEFLDRLLRSAALFLQQADGVNVAAAHLCVLTLLALLEKPSARDVLLSTSSSLRIGFTQRRKYPLPLSSAPRAIAICTLDFCLVALSCCSRPAVPVETHCAVVQLLLHVLHHARRAKARVAFQWGLLWPAMIASLRYVAAMPGEQSDSQQQQQGATRSSNDPVAARCIDMLLQAFSLAIAHGDDLLPDAAAYDHLIYEIIRSASVFDACESFINTVVKPSERSGAASGDVRCDLSFIKAVLSHFAPHLFEADWSPEQILAILRQHVSSLEIKRAAYLDVVPIYAENPTHAAWFRFYARETIPLLRTSPSVTRLLR